MLARAARASKNPQTQPKPYTSFSADGGNAGIIERQPAATAAESIIYQVLLNTRLRAR